MRTYRTALALAARGHDVHVVTNAREVAPPFRMHMRPEDWARCEARFGRGAVTVHWTDPVDRSQAHIPMASPFVSKLTSIAGRIHSAHSFDVILSHYMEPYGIAGHLAAEMTGVPHVVRMAGSDAGRLWQHPQLEGLYDHVLKSAAFVIAVGPAAERSAARGVAPARIVPGGAYALPDDEFAPNGSALDLNTLRAEVALDDGLRDMLWGSFAGDRPYFGVYGKLGDNKGSFALLEAMHRLKLKGLDVGLIALAHGRPEVEQRFRKQASELGLSDRIQQIPFLPHWRVPEFLRSCLAVCCLEQDFPIHFHSPIVPFEVLLCGSCLVASTEMIRKLPQWDRLPHGYGCVAVKDVNDVQELSSKLASIVCQPQLVGAVGARGRAFAQDCQQGLEFPQKLERVLEAAADRIEPSSIASRDTLEAEQRDRFPLTQIARAALLDVSSASPAARERGALGEGSCLAVARKIRTKLKAAIAKGHANLRSFVHAVEIEIAIAEAEIDLDRRAAKQAAIDPLFRMSIGDWALDKRTLGRLMPLRDPRLHILRFEYDISAFLRVRSVADFPDSVEEGPSHLVVFSNDVSREPAWVDQFTARILELSDGTRSGDEIVSELDQEFGRNTKADHLAWLEHLLVSGLIGFRDARGSA
jgi:glycosyltransferase involved in cell wall biosynthesis